MTDTASAELNRPAPETLSLLLSRRSGSAKTMTGPGPDPDQLRAMLTAAARVPDHGKLAPWRFILFEGDARAQAGEMLAQVLAGSEAEVSRERLEQERGRFLRAPLVIAVVSRVREGIPIPEWEQILSAGAACQTLVLAAHAQGFVANWLTEWCAYHPGVRDRLGLRSGERIAGFVYVGRPAVPLAERPRPRLEDVVSSWAPDNRS